MSVNVEYSRLVNKGIADIRRKFPKLVGEAGEKHIWEVISRFTGPRHDIVPTLDLYELALENPPSHAADEPKVALDYQSGKLGQEAQAAVAARDQRNRDVWVNQILPRYDVKDWEANFQLAVEYSNGELTLAKFEYLLQNTPPGFKLAFGDERAELLTKIRERLRDPYGRRMTAMDLESQMKNKYAFRNRMELRAALAEITDRQTTAAKSVSQLKSEIEPQLAARRIAAGVEVRPGRKVLSVEISAAEIHKMTSNQIKALIRTWGPDAVNDRLFGRS